MASDAQRFGTNSLPPVGLAGLFQMKSSGNVPEPNANGLQFVFETIDFYVRGQESYLVGNASTTVLGISGVLDATTVQQWIVPAGQGWLITSCEALMVAAATDYRRARVVAGTANVPGIIPVTEEFNTNPLATAVASRGVGYMPFGKYILAPPGYAFSVDTLQVTGVAINCIVRLRYYQFPWS